MSAKALGRPKRASVLFWKPNTEKNTHLLPRSSKSKEGHDIRRAVAYAWKKRSERGSRQCWRGEPKGNGSGETEQVWLACKKAGDIQLAVTAVEEQRE